MYNVIIALSGYLAVQYEWKVQFDMQYYMTEDDMLRMFVMQSVLIVGLIIGFNIARFVPSMRYRRVFGRQIWSAQVHSLGVVCLVLIAVYTTIVTVESFNTERGGIVIERVMSGKLSQFLLILVSYLTLINLYGRKHFRISIFLTFYISALFAVGDGTRSALLPIAIIIIYGLLLKQYRISFIGGILLIFMLILLAIGRHFVSSQELNLSEMQSVDWYAVPIAFWNYLTTFSALHASYAASVANNYFGTPELIYCILPIPSAILSPPTDVYTWRVDQFRPLGAQAEMWGISPILNLLFAVIVGFLCQRAARVDNKVASILIFGIIFLSYAMSFQYGLRTVQWFLWGTVILLILLPKHQVRSRYRMTRKF